MLRSSGRTAGGHPVVKLGERCHSRHDENRAGRMAPEDRAKVAWFALPDPGKPYGPAAIKESAAQEMLDLSRDRLASRLLATLIRDSRRTAKAEAAINELLAQHAMHPEPVTPTVV